MQARLPRQVQHHMQSILELETVEHVYRSIIYYENLETVLGFIPTGMQKLLFRAHTRVRAGIDLSQDIEMQRRGSSIHLTLPDPRIIVLDIDETSLFQYFITENKNRIDWRKVSGEIQETKEQLREDAIARGILEQAKRNAEAALTSFFSLLGFSEVVFIWQDL